MAPTLTGLARMLPIMLRRCLVPELPRRLSPPRALPAERAMLSAVRRLPHTPHPRSLLVPLLPRLQPLALVLLWTSPPWRPSSAHAVQHVGTWRVDARCICCFVRRRVQPLHSHVQLPQRRRPIWKPRLTASRHQMISPRAISVQAAWSRALRPPVCCARPGPFPLHPPHSLRALSCSRSPMHGMPSPPLVMLLFVACGAIYLVAPPLAIPLTLPASQPKSRLVF